jgi:glutathione transport system permease protein
MNQPGSTVREATEPEADAAPAVAALSAAGPPQGASAPSGGSDPHAVGERGGGNSSRVRTPWTEFWRKFRRQHVALVALAFVLLLVAIAVLSPWIVPYDPENYFDYDALNQGPSWAHWMGVDPLGRDIFSRILAGTRISLAAGFFSVAIGGIVGSALGLLAGYYGGWWDRIVMRISDVLFAFPGILLALGVVAILGSSMVNVVVAVSVFSVPAFARLVRGNTLVLKQMTYVEAVRSVGASDWTIVMRHILPGSISAIVVYFTMRLGTSIITAASLSFLGMGAQPPTPEWGAMLNEARADMVNAPHVALFPSLAIFFTVLAFNLLGDGLRDALDPKIDRT